MFKREREIWSDPYADKNGDEIPEMVYRVNDALRIISELFHSDLTDAELLDRGIDPDMANEFCMFEESEWPEIEAFYCDEDGFITMGDSLLVGKKQTRAQMIRDGLDPETGESWYAEPEPEPTYEEWKATLSPADLEFPHHLYMEGHRHDYVDRLVLEREMFEEIAMREMEQMY